MHCKQAKSFVNVIQHGEGRPCTPPIGYINRCPLYLEEKYAHFRTEHFSVINRFLRDDNRNTTVQVYTRDSYHITAERNCLKTSLFCNNLSTVCKRSEMNAWWLCVNSGSFFYFAAVINNLQWYHLNIIKRLKFDNQIQFG